MAELSLQDRLRDHAKAFDGLLSLIPAKMYYGEDNSDQWQKKKQTKAEAAAARRNKLDPDSELNRSVKEVMDEQAQKKRKRDQTQDGDEDVWSDVDGVDAETPRQGMKSRAQKDAQKKQKIADDATQKVDEKERRKEEKKQARKERKAERQMLREEEAAFERQTIRGVNKVKLGPRQSKPNSENATNPSVPDSSTKPSQSIEDDESEPESADQSDMQAVDVTGIVAADGQQNGEDISTSPSEPQSPVFDTNGTPADSTGQPSSTTTSVSSTVPPSEKPKHIKIPQDTAALRERLAARIQALRDARKADRDGKPVRTRQELIEVRRQKEAERKANKKALWKQQKADADKLREEALASARNSPGSMLSPAIDADNNFSFGRVAFGDGTQLSQDLTHSLTKGKKKGPSDAKTALLKLESQKKRLEDMDKEKRKDIEEKEAWLTARRRAEGEKIKDDEKLLKRAVKRKDQAKKKSTKEWNTRLDGVNKSIKEKQKKREQNIQQRRDEKLTGKGGKKKGGAKKPKGRAGFEGSFKVGGKRK